MSEVDGQRLPRALRLRRSPEYQRVQRAGRRVHLADLVVVWLANDLGRPRFGLAVSRKVGGAVVRNRVKRWLREAVRRQRIGVPALDVVFIARPSAAGAGYDALYSEVGDVLQQLRSAVARVGG